MKWYWKVRCYTPTGNYYIVEVETERDIKHIGLLQDFYAELTGCHMVLLEMSEQSFGFPKPYNSLPLWGTTGPNVNEAIRRHIEELPS